MEMPRFELGSERSSLRTSTSVVSLLRFHRGAPADRVYTRLAAGFFHALSDFVRGTSTFVTPTSRADDDAQEQTDPA